jgi:prophage regulatory protein
MTDHTEPKPSQVRAARHLAAVNASTAPRRFLRIADVQAAVGLSAGCIYKLVKRGEFPAPVKLTSRSSAWLATELDLWIERRAQARQPRAA